MMSPKYHPAMKIVSPVRKKLKVKTVFNILGPMLNPARVPFGVVGVYKEGLVSTFTMNSKYNIFSSLQQLKIANVCYHKLRKRNSHFELIHHLVQIRSLSKLCFGLTKF